MKILLIVVLCMPVFWRCYTTPSCEPRRISYGSDPDWADRSLWSAPVDWNKEKIAQENYDKAKVNTGQVKCKCGSTNLTWNLVVPYMQEKDLRAGLLRSSPTSINGRFGGLDCDCGGKCEATGFVCNKCMQQFHVEFEERNLKPNLKRKK